MVHRQRHEGAAGEHNHSRARRLFRVGKDWCERGNRDIADRPALFGNHRPVFAGRSILALVRRIEGDSAAVGDGRGGLRSAARGKDERRRAQQWKG